jgi:hypothetical protein
MKRLLLTFLMMFCIFCSLLYGQMGARQAGFRTGFRSGIFYQVTGKAGTAEIGYNAMLSFYNKGLQITGLRIVYETVLQDISPDLYFAWGYGGHVGFVYTDHLAFLGERYYFHSDRFCPLIGADGWGAIEYRFRDIPLNISLNLKPYVELTAPAFVRLMPGDFGISVSYVF